MPAACRATSRKYSHWIPERTCVCEEEPAVQSAATPAAPSLQNACTVCGRSDTPSLVWLWRRVRSIAHGPSGGVGDAVIGLLQQRVLASGGSVVNGPDEDRVVAGAQVVVERGVRGAEQDPLVVVDEAVEDAGTEVFVDRVAQAQHHARLAEPGVLAAKLVTAVEVSELRARREAAEDDAVDELVDLLGNAPSSNG